MAKFSKANLKKTLYYLKRNGLRDTYLAALERLQKKDEPYSYTAPTEEELAAQKAEFAGKEDILFSILVPLYHTPKVFLTEMIDSCLGQSYGRFELILADASRDDSVKEIVDTYEDERIRYVRLEENGGISENTNEALKVACGDYIGLLDHDDVLGKDALYENAKRIHELRLAGICAKLLYSDEDKCDESGKNFYEPHFKQDFNLDLLLSNNYICHFTVLEASLMKRLGFRKEYDGAQDFDLFLRAVADILYTEGQGKEVGKTDREAEISHIGKMLYHWRCHSASTAENPESKQYAYEAGKNAVADFCKNQGFSVCVEHTKHLGFYRVNFLPDLLSVREDVAMVGGPLYKKGKMVGGVYDRHGMCLFRGLKKGFSGYMHKAVLKQDVYAVDVRKMKLSDKWLPLYEKMAENFWKTEEKSEKAYRKLSLMLCRELHKQGLRIVFDPYFEEKK